MSTQAFKITTLVATLFFSAIGCSTAFAKKPPQTPKQTVNLNAVTAQGIGQNIGEVTLFDSPQGLTIQTKLSHLPSGFHGFHIHEHASCAPAEKDGKMGAALAAGGHFNPNNVAKHGTPNDGHLGDLPVLNVDGNGNARTTVIAPRLKLADIQGRSIMVHAGGDNYSDYPKPLGGGGDRIACGVIQ
ncbi:superoxide dismutase family protein [Acinetobacter pullicarnis]|uniref:superoxide dismutase family protein n=1 Tax=Acinetobacter pullicarnis TaxID=2576829 RepID=UPI00111CA5FF|nr:superoxide dismutase family protein [Acinetobacter pullicarnis]